MLYYMIGILLIIVLLSISFGAYIAHLWFHHHSKTQTHSPVSFKKETYALETVKARYYLTDEQMSDTNDTLNDFIHMQLREMIAGKIEDNIAIHKHITRQEVFYEAELTLCKKKEAESLFRLADESEMY